MYAICPQRVELLWRRLRDELFRQGVEPLPAKLCWPNLLTEHWRDPQLLLSQTCGYPLVTALPGVQVVGRFHYSAPGCAGGDYRSLLVVRDHDRRRALADFRHGTAACNSPDSHSGYNILRFMVAPWSSPTRFFQRVAFTGSHLRSLDAIREGQADIAAVDCVTFELVNRARPRAVAGLRVLAATPAAPGLPLITAAATPRSVVLQLRAALTALMSGTAGARACAALLITGFSPAEREDYQVILDMRQAAQRLAVTRLE